MVSKLSVSEPLMEFPNRGVLIQGNIFIFRSQCILLMDLCSSKSGIIGGVLKGISNTDNSLPIPSMPCHIAPHNHVFTNRKPRVDVGLTVLIVSLIEVEGEDDTYHTDAHNLLLKCSMSGVLNSKISKLSLINL